MKRKIASIDSNVLENEENFNFVEEIPENQVKEPDYLDEKDHKRRNILVLIIILLLSPLITSCIFLGLLLAVFFIIIRLQLPFIEPGKFIASPISK